MTPSDADRAPRLVGREWERRWLEERLAAARAGRGTTVLLNGATGIGKTALLDALAHSARAHGLLVLRGSGHDLAATQPFELWIEVVRTFQRQASVGLANPVPPAFLTPASAAAGAGSQSAIFNELLAFLRALATRQPILLALEDLQWADRESLELFRVVARELKEQPVLMVGSYRAGDLEQDAPLARLIPQLVREAQARQLDLAPLDESSVAELVTERYDLEAESRQRLIAYLSAHAEGNPLFITELLHSLEAARKLRRAANGWLLEELQPLPIPIFLRQIIDARFSRLPAEIRHSLAVAAVIGPEFQIQHWGLLCNLSQAELLQTLEQSIQAGLLEIMPDSVSARLSHAMFQRALYETVLPPRRSALHREIGELLATTDNPDPDLIAWHFQAAGDERAAAWLLRAAERAQRAYAWSAAAERLSTAENLIAERAGGAELGWLRYRIGRMRRHSDTADAMHRLRQAEQLGVWSHDPALTAYARFDLGHTEVLSGAYARGLERMLSGDCLLDDLAQAQVRLAPAMAAWVSDALPDMAEQLEVHPTGSPDEPINPRRGVLIQWLVEPGRYREAWELASNYIAQFEQMRLPGAQHMSSAGDTWYALGRVHAARGEPEESRQAFSRAIDCYERIDHHLLVSATLRVLLGEVVIPYRAHRLEERSELARLAEESHAKAAGVLPSRQPVNLSSAELLLLEGHWRRALDILTHVAAPGVAIASVRHWAVARLGWLACHQGQTQETWQRIRQVLPAGPSTAPGNTSFVPGIELIEVAVEQALRQQDYALAADWLATFERWLEWSRAARWRPAAQLARARLSMATGDIKSARRLAAAALELADEPRQPLVYAASRRLLGELATATGDLDRAQAHLTAALETFQACHARYETALSELALAALQGAAGEFEAASATLAASRSTLEQLAAAPALGRAQAIQESLRRQFALVQPSYNLSKREQEVLRLVAAGLTDAEVAAQLSISYRTVTTHLSSIFNKLGVNSRVLATRFAIEHELL